MTVDPSDPAANATTTRPRRRLFGVVHEFDFDRKLGTIIDPDGRIFRFHAVELSDGTRSIEVNTRVAFDGLARLGEVEACRIDTIDTIDSIDAMRP